MHIGISAELAVAMERRISTSVVLKMTVSITTRIPVALVKVHNGLSEKGVRI